MNQHLRKKARLTSFLRQALKPFFAICALAPVFAPHHAAAQMTYYWGLPAGGNWDFITANWSTNAPGSAVTQWSGQNPAILNNTAVFQVTPTGGDTAINLTGTTAGRPANITLSKLTFAAGTFSTSYYDVGAAASVNFIFTGHAVVAVLPGFQGEISAPLTTDTVSATPGTDTLTFTANATAEGAATIGLKANNTAYTVPLLTVTGGIVVEDFMAGGGALPNVATVVGVTTVAGNNLTGP
jgi:hypothetical protein